MVSNDTMDEPKEGSQEAAVSQALSQFQATLQAAVREVHMDVNAFKQRMEQRVDELCVSNRPLAEAVKRLQEENLQLRAKLEALSLLVEGLPAIKTSRSPPDETRKTEEGLENGHEQTQSKTQEYQRGPVNSEYHHSEAPVSNGGSGAAASNVPAPPPWRARRHAEMNVSIHHVSSGEQNKTLNYNNAFAP